MAAARSFRFRIVRSAIYAFALIGFLDTVGRGILMPLTGTFYGLALRLPFDIDVQKVVVSPDDSMKAIVYVWSGPAFDAGCEKMVAVVDSWKPTNAAWQPANLVYRADCDSVDQITWELPASG